MDERWEPFGRAQVMIALAAAGVRGEAAAGAPPVVDPGRGRARPEPVPPLGADLASLRNYAPGLAFGRFDGGFRQSRWRD